MKYRKKPVVIEAFQWTGSNANEMAGHLLAGGEARRVDTKGPNGGTLLGGALIITTLEGEMRADPGDWIIKGIKGEFYPCKPDIFEATYEPA